MINLIFFDIECSNCYGGEGKICEFGAVLTDENFNIIREYDIPMSPGKGRESRFDTKIFKRDPKFNWAYDFDYYFSCGEFPEFYDLISKIMQDKNTLVFGYAVDNDIRFLGSTVKRYHLKQLSYTAYDAQKIIRNYTKGKIQVNGLKSTFESFCGKELSVKLEPHLSRDDAKMTMMIFKKLCENLNIGITELIKRFNECVYNSPEYFEAYEKRKERKKNNKNKSNKEKCEIESNKSQCQILWGDTCREDSILLDKEESIGNIVTISSKLKEDIEVTTKIINAIKKNNLVTYDKISGSDLLVVYDEKDKQRLLKKLQISI